MSAILSDFQEYLLTTATRSLNKKLANNTLIAYKADISDFLNFIFKKNKKIHEIKSKDFFDFIGLLHEKKLSVSSGIRKIAALKAFAAYLHEKHNIADYTQYIQHDFSSLPIICSSKVAFKTIEEYKKTKLRDAPLDSAATYNKLRNFVILYLLYISKISIKQLVKLKISDINHDLSQLNLSGGKSIKLSPDFLKIIQEYVTKMGTSDRREHPHNNHYLFAIFKDPERSEAEPISKQAVWNILRSIFCKTKNNQLDSFNSCKFETTASTLSKDRSWDSAPELLLNIYKNKHPRP